MKKPLYFNVLRVVGLDGVGSVKDCYLGTLKMMYNEFTRGYVEPRVLLFLLYGSRYELAQQFFLHRLPPDATCFFTIPWEQPDCGSQVRTLIALLHVCFASYPNVFIDEFAFHQAYDEFELWRRGG